MDQINNFVCQTFKALFNYKRKLAGVNPGTILFKIEISFFEFNWQNILIILTSKRRASPLIFKGNKMPFTYIDCLY